MNDGLTRYTPSTFLTTKSLSPPMFDQLTIKDFESRISAVFHLTLDDSQSLELVLIDVTAFGSPPDPGDDLIRRQAFSLIFRGPEEPVLAQQICPLEHDEMGMLSLFLVPLGLDGQGMRYEAVFT
ncbi:MAG: hypothetical protein GY759_00305 [Chloroflexi bacterium]|nr:hypothetical protein [Chloroflexota bacterium]